MRTEFSVTAILATIALLLSTATTFAEDCNQEQAYNKMNAINRALTREMAKGDHSPTSKGVRLTTESAPIGELLAAQKYTEACNKYNELAKKYGIDLKKESEGLLTMEQLAKDGGKQGGECGMVEAHKKMMDMHQQLEDKAALGDVDRDVFRQFGEDTSKFSELMFTNPSEVCRRLDLLKPKYKVN